ncbi:Trp-rich small protein [Staphylococcus equorum]
MAWWQEIITTLLTGSLLVVFRIWLESKWKDK